MDGAVVVNSVETEVVELAVVVTVSVSVGVAAVVDCSDVVGVVCSVDTDRVVGDVDPANNKILHSTLTSCKKTQ